MSQHEELRAIAIDPVGTITGPFHCLLLSLFPNTPRKLEFLVSSNATAELRSCANVELAVLVPNTVIVFMVYANVKQQ